MRLIPAKCTNCGANLNVDNTKDALVCSFCGSAFIVEKAIQLYIRSEQNISGNEFEIVAGVLKKYKGASTDPVIPDSVYKIDDKAFERIEGLKSVVLPQSVTEIGDYAFSECVNLRKINLSQVKKIGRSAFSGCNNLISVDLDNVVIISEGTFSSCRRLCKVKWSNAIYSIGNYAFHLCSHLTIFQIPDSVYRIGSEAFKGCNVNLESLSPSIKELGDNPFGDIDTIEFTGDIIKAGSLSGADKIIVPNNYSIKWVDGHGVYIAKMNELSVGSCSSKIYKRFLNGTVVQQKYVEIYSDDELVFAFEKQLNNCLDRLIANSSGLPITVNYFKFIKPSIFFPDLEEKLISVSTSKAPYWILQIGDSNKRIKSRYKEAATVIFDRDKKLYYRPVGMDVSYMDHNNYPHSDEINLRNFPFMQISLDLFIRNLLGQCSLYLGYKNKTPNRNGYNQDLFSSKLEFEDCQIKNRKNNSCHEEVREYSPYLIEDRYILRKEFRFKNQRIIMRCNDEMENIDRNQILDMYVESVCSSILKDMVEINNSQSYEIVFDKNKSTYFPRM